MGRVWRATDVVLHRDVAIKELVPPPGLTPDERQEMRERSLREARAIARLNNINVVRVFDVLRTDADPWIVMEYVPSRSLQDILAADGPFNPVRAAEIGLGVLGALRAAHRAGVVHRDVKPGNVLIGEDGRVVLTDFGLATVPGDPNVTRTGLVLGSPAYIAPERARDGTAGPGADLWSLGATLYAAVEGASPFARPSAIATLAALATENPPPARNAGPLKPVLNGLLRKDPAHRINAEEAERLPLRAAGRRSKLAFPMSPTMRRPGVGRERPPVVPGVSASAPVVPGPRPPVTNSGGAPAPAPAPAPAAEPAAEMPVEIKPPDVKPVEDKARERAEPARATPSDVDELLDAVGEAHARFSPLRTGTTTLDRLHRAAESLAYQLRVGRTPGQAEAARNAAVRLAADLGMMGRQLTDTVEQVERELDEVRGRAERLRLVPAFSIFTALHRAVRDAADTEGKRIRFEGRGGELRMDPQVLALASGALSHVVRNAVVHGIEDEPGRAAAGKPAEGHVVVEIQRRGRYAAFLCTDDGRGFDLAAVRRTALARGLLMPGSTEPDQQTLVDLVLRGGISTSPTVTEVAGRGIGLDVARDVADQLGGDVAVRTGTGRGTTIELVLPLALLSLHGLIVEAAGTVATVPLDAVRTCVRLLPEQATTAAVTGKLAHNGEAVPFLPLARALYAGTAVPEGGGPGVAVIVAADGDSVAVGVDRLAGTSTLVVRPLPDLAPAAPVIGGVSMDLDGNPRLVLDAQGLIAETARSGSGGVAVPEPARRLPILVVDDSLTTRMLERSILESAGFEVDLAASGEEGLERARGREYGLFLTDIDMPGINGFEFVEQTRADPGLAKVPAILVSSRASAEDRARGAAAGASAYVVKGEFNQEELLAHIRRLVAS